MTTITIERDLLGRALDALDAMGCVAHMGGNLRAALEKRAKAISDIRAALVAQPSEPKRCGHCGRRTIDPPWTISPAAQQLATDWHDAPTVPGLWAVETVRVIDKAQIKRIGTLTYRRWYGPIPPDSGETK